MARRTTAINALVNLLNRFFGDCRETGAVKLAAGRHELSIVTDGSPRRVWLSFGDDDDDSRLPVCHGSVDVVGVQITDDGFVLYADIRSTERTVKWAATV